MNRQFGLTMLIGNSCQSCGELRTAGRCYGLFRRTCRCSVVQTASRQPSAAIIALWQAIVQTNVHRVRQLMFLRLKCTHTTSRRSLNSNLKQMVQLTNSVPTFSTSFHGSPWASSVRIHDKSGCKRTGYSVYLQHYAVVNRKLTGCPEGKQKLRRNIRG